MKFKYLYKVVYNDGSTYEQNEEDISIIDHTKSCYSDLKLDEIKTFTLYNDENWFSLDLATLTFYFKKHIIFKPTHTNPNYIKLKHFRRNTITIQSDGKIINTEYHLGYTGEDDGKLIGETIIIT
jgi:hypothetical protein